MGNSRLTMFRSQPAKSPASGVDGRTIKRAKVIEAGDLNDSRPIVVDAVTLQQVADIGNGATRGIKARWTHPHMSSDGLGTTVARARNFRVEGNAVYADFTMLSASDNSPKGQQGAYLLELAQEDSETFGLSIVADFSDEMLAALESLKPGEKAPLRIKGLRAVDFVDEPAATRGGLFDLYDKRDLAPVVSSLIETHFSGVPKKEVVERLLGFLSLHYGEDAMAEAAVDAVETQQQEQAAPVAPAPAAMSLEAAQPFLVAFGDRGAKWFLEGKTMQECLSIVNGEIGEANAKLQSQVDELTAKLAAIEGKLGEEQPLSAAPAGKELTAAQIEAAERKAKLAKAGADDKAIRWAGAFAPRSN